MRLEEKGDTHGRSCSFELSTRVSIRGRQNLKKKVQGSFDFRTETQNNIQACPADIFILGSWTLNNVQRWWVAERKYIEVPKPHVVAEYNQHMGGVDLNDMLILLYRMDIGTKNYYFHIFYRLIHICIVNAWLLYRMVLKNANVRKVKPLIIFKLEVAHGLLTLGKKCSLKRTRSSSRELSASPSERSYWPGPSRPTTLDARFDNIAHLPIYGKKLRCNLCKNIISYSRIKCVKCNVNLCITSNKNCFLTLSY